MKSASSRSTVIFFFSFSSFSKILKLLFSTLISFRFISFSLLSIEFAYLNRGNYKNFLISLYDKSIGGYNWKWMFRFVFLPWTESDVRDFLSDFADFDIIVSHKKKGALDTEQQGKILSFLIHSMEFTRSLNQCYVKLLREKISIKKDDDSNWGQSPRLNLPLSFYY